MAESMASDVAMVGFAFSGQRRGDADDADPIRLGMLKSIASFIDRIDSAKSELGIPMHPSELPRGAQSSFDRLSNRRDPAEGVSA